MKRLLSTIVVVLIGSATLFCQTPNNTFTHRGELPRGEIRLPVEDENSSVLHKDGHDGFIAGITLSITPNPTFGNTMLILSTELPTSVQIRLLDASLNLVQVVSTNQLSSGTNHIPANFSALTPGIYYVEAITSSSAALKKMFVM